MIASLHASELQSHRKPSIIKKEPLMNREEPQATQAPFKERYRNERKAAAIAPSSCEGA